MSLLSIPTELRLYIYSYLPNLHPSIPHEMRPKTALTPSISRVCHVIRQETLPIYAKNTAFSIPLDASPESLVPGVTSLLDSLGPKNVSRIRTLTISRHWSIPQPLRWQGHVGFYVRIERRKPRKFNSRSSVNSASSFRPEWDSRFVRPMAEGIWEVTTGTYPVARDIRGMRLESVELLAEIIRHHLHVPTPLVNEQKEEGSDYMVGLTAADVHFLVQAMGVVASHPIGAYDIDQAENARKRRLETWSGMEQQLKALNVRNMGGASADGEAQPSSAKRFFTPY